MSQIQQPQYQTVVDCTYWNVLGTFNNWYIIKFTNKTTLSEEFNDIHKVSLYGISYNTEPLVQYVKYFSINTYNLTTIGYYAVKYISGAFKLQ